ncbi:unnamed protein product [Linum tenue]|uniref:Protein DETOXIFICATION n=1 Tax=Linum tenue TaxID=586396 RepID=A0AAV0INF1_9ROSI|nr:unnamed protein product [Linum tenue]
MSTTQFHRYWTQLKKMWELAGPAMVIEVSQFSIALVTSAFVGHIGPLELAAVSIVLNVLEEFALGFMVLCFFSTDSIQFHSLIKLVIKLTNSHLHQLGIGSATETLSGQAVGAEKLHLLGIYMQRSWLLSMATALLLAPFYALAAPIFHKLLRQDAKISELAGRFSMWMLPQLFFFAMNFPLQKFLQAQSRVWVLAAISSSVLLIHVVLSWGFVSRLGFGVVGAAVAGDVSWFLLVVAQAGYVAFGSFESWNGFSVQAFSSFPGFARLSLASAVLSCLNIQYWSWIIAAGFNTAVSIRVSNELGAGNHEAAKLSVVVTIVTATVLGLTFSAVVAAAKSQVPKLFSSDPQVIRESANLTYFSSAAIFLDIIIPVLHGVAVGAGWQVQVAVVNIVCYYVVGLPLTAVLGFGFELGVKGIWSGMVAGYALQMAFLLFVIYRTNWEKEASKSEERMKNWGEISGE